MDLDELKHQIDAQRVVSRAAEKELWRLKGLCTHRLRELTKDELRDKWMSVSATCDVCGERFGWRCKLSPDKVCHYFSEDEEIELIDGSTISIPVDHDSTTECENCIFCGMPDERK